MPESGKGNNVSRLAALSDEELSATLEGLQLFLSSSRSNGFFHNADKGHGCYRGEGIAGLAAPDDPDQNELFRFGHEVLAELNSRDSELHGQQHNSPFQSWNAFCAVAAAAYELEQHQRESGGLEGGGGH